MVEEVDTVVIGGGMAGLPLALRAARYGPTVLIERDLLGGTCLNRGCIPTKTLIHSAKVAHLARTAGRLGVKVTGVEVDLAAAVDRKDEIVASIRGGSERSVEGAENLKLVHESAMFVGPRLVTAGDRIFEADRVVINTGARPAVPDLKGLRHVPFLDSTSALDLRHLPGHLIVLGGGYVGCEFAQMYRRFGSEVTILQRSDRLLRAEDPDVSEVIETAFAEEGIDVRPATLAERVEPVDGGIRVTTADGPIDGTHLLVAVGRTPNTDGLGLELARVEVDERGFVVVDETYRTTAEGTYAIGDVIGPPMFTHTARDDAALLARHLFRGEDISVAHRLVPHAVFTDPEVASFGLTEADAKKRWGDEANIGTERFKGVAKARAMAETRGFIRIVADPDRKIRGATIVGPDAGNLIHELVVAATGGMTVDEVRRSIHIHPTLAEGVNAAAGGVHRPSGS